MSIIGQREIGRRNEKETRSGVFPSDMGGGRSRMRGSEGRCEAEWNF